MPYSAKLFQRFLSGLLFTLFAVGATAQPGYLTLSGKVINQETGEPVPFASITVVGRSIGTVSNVVGTFLLKIPGDYANDSVKVSSVGYQSVTQRISATSVQNQLVRLKAAAVTLDEVRVQARRKTAVDILREAVAAIPRNYDTTSVQMTAFYREDTQFENQPVAFNEAVLSVYKAAYGKPDAKDQLKLIKGRKKEFDRSKHNLPSFINLSNGARNSLMADYLKQPIHKNSLLNERNFKYYDFTLSTLMGDRMTYVIDIKPGKRQRKAYLTGKFYIDAQTLAFVRSEWRITQAGLDLENNRDWLLKKMASIVHKLNLKMSDFYEIITYEPYKGKWHLSNVERRYVATINSQSRNLVDKTWKVSTSFTVTEVGPKGIPPFAEGDIAENRNSMSTLIGEQNDPDFWENYNIQRPVSADTVSEKSLVVPTAQPSNPLKNRVGNRQNGFTRADTLRGKLSPLRSKYDVTFYDLAVKVDIENKAISGKNRMRFKVLAPLDKLQVDLYANMTIHQIRYGGKSLAYTREFNAVFVQFPEKLQPGSEQELEIDYSGKPQVPDFSVPMVGGFLWDKDKEGNPWVQVVCQGSGASLWWPNKDHLSDEPDSMRIRVTVPDRLMDISNGRLLRKTALPGNWTEYEWYVSYPINNYNVTLNIGKYAHRREMYGPDSLTLDYYCMPYHQEKFRWVFDGVKPMLAILEKHYGKYPFPRDGFTLMESLYPMEHQSAVSFGKMPNDSAGPLTLADTLRHMQLVWHEVSHEWWGNNVSCRDMADMWIHEAFATYSEGFYLDSAVPEEGELGYIASLPRQVIGKEPIIGVYDVNHIHYDIGDMYAKGALVLYTFRHLLNDDQRWGDILKGMQQRFRLQTVSTKDIVGYINEKTGTDYTWFFDQYLNYTSIPTLEVQLLEKGSSLVVKYRWKADVPNFRMPIAVTKKPEQFNFIMPTTDWQTMTLPNMTIDDFEVDETRFYVRVEVEEPQIVKQ
ncbi:carboxypeptidase-like regulatory domain-containing protein [Larkinella sp. VNQ87]|uniref:carboxypeptidase-like regulatory domain-containing protein n=1 Tax=Larkinella sp. VNQ87 TaxID=3400921 RepID=UPI003C088438